MLRSKLGSRPLAIALVAFLAVATGCASGGFTPMTCAAIGAVAGGAGGAVYGTNHDKGHDIDSGVGYGVAIGVATGTAAYFLCKALGVGEQEAAPPPPPAPEPAPEPREAPPAEEPAPAPQAQRIVLRGVQFEFDKSDIRPDAGVILDEAASQLSQVPGARVSVEGHTDSSGSDAYNQSLSERRAASVKDYLVGKGVEGGRLTTAGYGESQPVADNATDEGRALNRRVELKVQE
jgi:outer membrane protein OmpA-like peptidoglycan-associated protein